MLDDPADDDTDDSDTGQAPQKIQIRGFFEPGPEQLGQPNVKEKEKIIDMSKDHMDV